MQLQMAAERVGQLLPTWRKSRLRPMMTHYLGFPEARPGAISRHMRLLGRQAAQRQGVEFAVHPDDFIYWFLVKNVEPLEAAITAYFEHGATSARLFDEILSSLGLVRIQPLRLLEFAAGYGCVSRHLKRNAQLDLVSCDIHSQALEFLEHELGIRTLMSSTVPESFSLPMSFDVVFALSFFSHMPKSSFGRWLRALYDAVSAPGYMIFTTHGLESHKLMGSPPIPADGFYFKPSSEQLDLDTEEYGTTITTPEFVAGELLRRIGVSNVAHTPTFWGHQDLWIVKREQ